MFTFQEFSDFVESLTPTIRETVGKYIGKVHVDYKADDSPVTLADKEIERYIVSRIESRFPDGVIVGSAIVKLCGQYGRECVPHVAEYVKKMAAALEKQEQPSPDRSKCVN